MIWDIEFHSNFNGVTVKDSGWKIKTQPGTEKVETMAGGFHWIPKGTIRGLERKCGGEIPSLDESNQEIFERERKRRSMDDMVVTKPTLPL